MCNFLFGISRIAVVLLADGAAGEMCKSKQKCCQLAIDKYKQLDTLANCLSHSTLLCVCVCVCIRAVSAIWVLQQVPFTAACRFPLLIIIACVLPRLLQVFGFCCGCCCCCFKIFGSLCYKCKQRHWCCLPSVFCLVILLFLLPKKKQLQFRSSLQLTSFYTLFCLSIQ